MLHIVAACCSARAAWCTALACCSVDGWALLDGAVLRTLLAVLHADAPRAATYEALWLASAMAVHAPVSECSREYSLWLNDDSGSSLSRLAVSLSDSATLVPHGAQRANMSRGIGNVAWTTCHAAQARRKRGSCRRVRLRPS